MGISYEAERLRGGDHVLLKVSPPAAAEDRRAHSRYIMEAELVASLDHPHVVDFYDFGELEDGRPYVVTELLAGEDLARRLERKGPLTAWDVAHLLEQAGGALQLMHKQGILHRDLNPHRVFLVRSTEAGKGIQVKVLDFGISRLRMNLRLTRQEVSLETMLFMSPEQITGETSKIGHVTDVFALAAIAYDALSGRRPFDATSAAGLLGEICNEEPTPITDLLPDLPPDLHRVLSKGMAKQGEDRYQEVMHLAEDFGAVLSGKEPEHLGDWQPPVKEPEPEPEPEPAPVPKPLPRPAPHVNLPMPMTAPPAQEEPSQPSIVLSPQLRAFTEPTPFADAETEQLRSTAVMDVSAEDVRRRAEQDRRKAERDDRVTEEQEPVFQEAPNYEQGPATGILAVDELHQDLGKTVVEEPAVVVDDELMHQEADTDEEAVSPEKKTEEMSGPDLLALQQMDTDMLDRVLEQARQQPVRVDPDKETVKLQAPPSPPEEEEEKEEEPDSGGINMELMKTVREPD